MDFDFSFACPQCGATLHGKNEWIGKTATCNKCQGRLVVPPCPSPARQPNHQTSRTTSPPPVPPFAPAAAAGAQRTSSQRESQATDDYSTGRSDPERTSSGVIQVTFADTRPSNSLGIGSIVLAVVGLLTVCVPLIALPLLLLGLALGITGLVVAIKRKGGGIGLPIAGSAICAVLLIPPAIILLVAGRLHQEMNTNPWAQAAHEAGGGSLNTTDFGATMRWAKGLFKEWEDERTKAIDQNRGNQFALEKAIARVDDEGAKKIERELSKLRDQPVRWKFTVENVMSGGSDEQGRIYFKEAPRSAGFFSSDRVYVYFGQAYDPGYVPIGNGVPLSFAEKLRTGDCVLIKGVTQVDVGTRVGPYSLTVYVSFSVVSSMVVSVCVFSNDRSVRPVCDG